MTTESKVICGFSTVQWSVPLTPALFRGQGSFETKGSQHLAHMTCRNVEDSCKNSCQLGLRFGTFCSKQHTNQCASLRKRVVLQLSHYCCLSCLVAYVTGYRNCSGSRGGFDFAIWNTQQGCLGCLRPSKVYNSKIEWAMFLWSPYSKSLLNVVDRFCDFKENDI